VKIDHVNIVVSDLERSIAFYQDVLGLQRGFEAVLEGVWIETVTGLPGAAAECVFMEAPDQSVRLELLHYLKPDGEAVPANTLPHTPGIRHLAFQVPDLDGLVARLEALGVALVSPPVQVPFVVASMGRKRLCYFHDPDGTLLEAAGYSEE